MGRRSKSSKLQVNSNMHSREDPIDEESQPVIANHSPNGKKSRTAKTPLKKTITKQKIVRRSQRIQNTSISRQRKKQHTPEEIVISENEEQEEEEEPEPAQNDQTMEEQVVDSPSGHDGGKSPDPSQNDLMAEEPDRDDLAVDEVEKLSRLVENKRTISEKVDYLIELVEGQEKIIEELKAKASEGTCLVTKKIVSSPGARYRSMYFESQNKLEELTNENREMAMKLENALGKNKDIEQLTSENHQLALKLATALGKIEVYEHEKGHDISSQVLEKVKDFLLVTNLSKLAETTSHSGASPENEPEEARIANGKKKRRGG